MSTDHRERTDCRCRECYRARADHIPPALMELAQPASREPWKISPPSAAVVHQVLNRYLAGELSYDATLIELAQRLAHMLDAVAGRELSRASLEAIRIVLPSSALPTK